MFTPKTLSTLAVAALAMAPSVRSHMIMATPKPFGSPNNSPLDPSGSDYPCKITGGAAGDGPVNEWAVGSSQQLSFSGSAVHGGGSCQIAVTTDKTPTKESKFKVIHSIEGGCPGVNGPSTFDFKIPDMLPDGDLVMAWTWFNHIGNREMYMNCANVKVSGGASDTSKFEKLPDMTLANIQVGSGASCKTAESSDYTFPGVGENGDTVERVGSGPFVDVCGGQASGAPAASSAPAASAPASSAPVVSPVPVSSAPPASPSDAVTSTIRTLLTVTAPTAPASATAPANSSAPAGSAKPTQAPAASSPAAAPSGGASTGGSCSSDGALVCNGDSQFGLCNNGKIVWQAVAPGTKCQNGKIARRDFVHRAQRRSHVHHRSF
ncbi:hypothetical protein BU23DRAFT_546852 [Bimuria novae-zelandiae CBS 107.79]|uniref:Lytic polysaccharide monooxygenase n=1 Tax=Bimuria novae-zelandiae CBS 107.79 TaxID=1447943 RepID=A0A6A5UI78_9PLEO|nr:hypothetical protein BU23DRAFT_546852 [Bimuria novae-zelandiae CBS 107.79]